jgi:hypothetical protein
MSLAYGVDVGLVLDVRELVVEISIVDFDSLETEAGEAVVSR